MNAIIEEPRRMNPLLRLGIFIAERTMGRTAVPARLLTATFDERQLVLLAATIASVNYWARFNQGLGVPPAGFGDHCLLPGRSA